MRLSTDQKFSVRCRITKLALFLLLALTSGFVNADAPADDRPIIMCPALPPHSGPATSASGKTKGLYEDAVIFRELGRQLVLNVFREEFGLPTRDESLFEMIDLTSDHLFEVDVITIVDGPFELLVRHKGKQVFSQKLNKYFAAGRQPKKRKLSDPNRSPPAIYFPPDFAAQPASPDRPRRA